MDIIEAILHAKTLDDKEPAQVPPVAVWEVRPLEYEVGRHIPDGSRAIVYIDGGIVPFEDRER